MVMIIKNMVCCSCKMVVKDILNKMGLHLINIDLGMAEIMEQLNLQQHEELNKNLDIGLKKIISMLNRI